MVPVQTGSLIQCIKTSSVQWYFTKTHSVRHVLIHPLVSAVRVVMIDDANLNQINTVKVWSQPLTDLNISVLKSACCHFLFVYWNVVCTLRKDPIFTMTWVHLVFACPLILYIVFFTYSAAFLSERLQPWTIKSSRADKEWNLLYFVCFLSFIRETASLV